MNLKKLGCAAFLIFSFSQSLIFLSSCEKMLETESDLVEFEEDHTLNHATDSVYSVMGIINKMQIIADRIVLLGEVRGDLVLPTAAANTDLKRLSEFNFSEKNRYNQISDYYAVINNCNYFLAHIDTAMERRGRNLFMREYAAVKSYRAWTYLQLAQAYGKVPLILKPLMTEREAVEAMNQTPADIKEICETFIADLTPYVGVNLPQYGNVANFDSKYLFIPMRALLGDLCLWAGRYQEAARYYHDYLTDKYEPIQMSRQSITWANSTQLNSVFDNYGPMGSSAELLSFIPMEARVFDGTISNLPNLFNSTTENNYFFELYPSYQMEKISASQTYCFEVSLPGATTKDTIYVPHVGLYRSELAGDLRYFSNHTLSTYGAKSDYTEYNSYMQTIYKVTSNRIVLYRRTMVYLRYAEALNRAGFPQSAFAILKYGICDDILKARVDAAELQAAGDLVYFDPELFSFDGTYFGVHSMGSGDSHANAHYTIPELDTKNDTIKCVEDMIITEMALEGAFEGYRFNDLMRIALRRNDPAYLADPVSMRYGLQAPNTELRQKLMEPKNWYLPLK